MIDSQCNEPLSKQLLANFLENRLSQQEVLGVESHLDFCQSCACLLRDAAGDPDLWSLVSELSDDQIDDQWKTFDNSRMSLLESSLRAESELAQDSVRTATLEMIRPLLTATDDPRSAGRIGNYEVHGLIGSGGMGVVLKARDLALDRIVAVKMLSPHLAVFDNSRQRFEREAKSAAAVKHEGIIPIYGVDLHAGIPYLVMPYEAGPSLAQRIAKLGRLSIEESLSVLAQLADALSAAHRCGLVHRDIKPSNILLAPGTERALLMDFGLAQATEEQAITMTGMLTGTPLYMSPEQARGEEVDGRSDLFSLGSVLYAMLTGETVVRPGNGYSIVRFIGSERMPAVRSVDRDLPDWLEALVGRLHEVEVDSRIQTADEVAGLANACLAHMRNPRQHPLPKELDVARKEKEATRSVVFWSAMGILVCLACVASFVVNSTWQPRNDQRPVSRGISSQDGHNQEITLPKVDDEIDTEIEDIGRTLDEIEKSDLEFETREIQDES